MLAELQYSVANSINKETNQIKLNTFLTLIEILDYPAECAQCYGEIRATLKKFGNIIGGNDLFIASHALTLNAILVTNNINKFQRIDNLKLENW